MKEEDFFSLSLIERSPAHKQGEMRFQYVSGATIKVAQTVYIRVPCLIAACDSLSLMSAVRIKTPQMMRLAETSLRGAKFRNAASKRAVRQTGRF